MNKPYVIKNCPAYNDDEDVSGCKYYLYRDKRSKGERCCGVGLTDCNGQMCLYKQLKLQEQENVRLREKFNNLISTPIYENCNLLLEQKRILEKCLQEIKTIAEADSPFIDNFEIKSATEVGYDYATICNELELRLHKVLELITKAESEEE